MESDEELIVSSIILIGLEIVFDGDENVMLSWYKEKEVFFVEFSFDVVFESEEEYDDDILFIGL